MYSDRECSRREFIKDATLLGFGTISITAAGGLILDAAAKTHSYHAPGTGLDLAVATNGTPNDNTEKAIKALGGMARFVKPGDKVVLKPNCISPRPPEFAINTHPEVVQTVTRLCMEAGASEVVAVTNDLPDNFPASGMEEALHRSGGTWETPRFAHNFRQVILPRGILLRRTHILNRVLDADIFINIPIAKHHAESQLTLGMKNFMGISFDRQVMHARGLHQCIADLNTAVKPHLTVMDANYMLLTNGPGGPGNTRNQKTVIAGTDPVLVDAYTATLFGIEPREVGHIRYAAEMGLGIMHLKAASIQEFKLQ
jgi:uncharacterized protein (DUF362 family)